MRDHVIIHVNGTRHEIRDGRAFQTLSDFLRYELQLPGTKVVCAEGDCGSCTVQIGRVRGGKLEYRTVCACIQFLCQLDGAHVVTIEGLGDSGALESVQCAMVACQGAQCGYCTPGFLMSLSMLPKDNGAIDERAVRQACVGNLCRCTGYEPIIRAGVQAKGKDNPSTKTPITVPAEPPSDDVLVTSGDRLFFQPRSLASACRFKQENPGCTVIAGATDIGVQVNKGLKSVGRALSLGGIDELRGIACNQGQLIIGATATLADLETVCRQHLPEYARLLYWFGSPQIRNAGTIGGNIANGSPIGDSMPALFVLNAEIELAGVDGSRRINMNDFYTGYRRTVMKPDELIARVHTPLPRDGEVFKLYKVSRRKDLDVSAFTAAFWIRRTGDTIDDIRIAFGGVAPTIVRMRRCEQHLIGKTLELRTLRDAGKLARTEIQPITDVRGSKEYRLQLAENIFRKLWYDLDAAHSSPVDNGQPVRTGGRA